MQFFFLQSGVIRIDGDIFFLEPLKTDDTWSNTRSQSTQKENSSEVWRRRLRNNNVFTNLSMQAPALEDDHNTLDDEVENIYDWDQRDGINEDLSDEESYLPREKFTIFGDSIESHVASPPRLHTFKKAGMNTPLGPQSNRAKRSPRDLTKHQSDRARTYNIHEENNAMSSDSLSEFSDKSEENEIVENNQSVLSQQARSDNLHICDTSGEYNIVIILFL